VDEAVDRNAVGAGVGKAAECKWAGVSVRLHLVWCDVGIGGILKAGVRNVGEELLGCTCTCAWLLFWWHGTYGACVLVGVCMHTTVGLR
jgi:hypothetical protein